LAQGQFVVLAPPEITKKRNGIAADLVARLAVNVGGGRAVVEVPHVVVRRRVCVVLHIEPPSVSISLFLFAS